MEIGLKARSILLIKVLHLCHTNGDRSKVTPYFCAFLPFKQYFRGTESSKATQQLKEKNKEYEMQIVVG